jgi:hypothetical protein
MNLYEVQITEFVGYKRYDRKREQLLLLFSAGLA